MIDDREISMRECDTVIKSLASAGVDVERVADLRTRSSGSHTALPILWSALREATSSGAACELIWAIAGQIDNPGDVRSLIAYARPLRGISFDLYTQLRKSPYLRGVGFQGRPPTPAELSAAKHAVEHGWYRSYERPSNRGSVRVSDPTFPDCEMLAIDAESHVVGMGLGNALRIHACPALFEDVATLLHNTGLGFGRALLPDVLHRCDRKRAPEHLVAVLNDPDIGLDAIEPLGKARYEPARQYIERFLDHPIERARRDARVALKRLDQASGTQTAARTPFEEVLPQSERDLGAKLVAADGEEPQDIKGKISAFVIGSLAEDERGWTRDHCYATSIELDELESTLRRLGRAFKGDFSGRRAKSLREEIIHADHETWNAYKLSANVGGTAEEIWFHYYLDDPTTGDLTFWGPRAFIDRLRQLLERK